MPAAGIDGRVGLIQAISRGGGFWIDAPKKMLGKPRDLDVGWDEYVVGQSPVFGALRDPKEASSDLPLTLSDTTQPADVLELWQTGAHDTALSEEAEAAHKQTYTSRRGKSKLKLEGSIQTGERRGENVTPASLTDRPGFAADQKHAAEAVVWKAETAAVVLDGPWAGTYLGSVRWGWRSDPQNGGLPTVTLDPDSIELVSGFVPSLEFLRAGLRWNESLKLEDPLGTHPIVPVPVPGNVFGFERWNLNDQSDAQLLKVKGWLLQHWDDVVRQPQLKLVAWQLVRAREGIGGDLEHRLRLQEHLESLPSLEQLNEHVVV